MFRPQRSSLATARLTLLALAISLSVCNAGVADTADTAEIAFTSEFSGGLYLMDVRTQAVKKESLGLKVIEDLSYSSRTRTMALIGSRNKEGERELFLLKLPGTTLQRVAYPKDATPYRPRFGADGKYLYAVNYGPEIFRYGVDGHEWTRLPVQGAQDLQAQDIALAPSGHLAAISPGDFKGFLIAELASDRLRVTRSVLTDFDSCTSAHWIDDGHIVFLGRKFRGYQAVWLLDLQTGQLHQLTQPPLGTRDFLSLSRDGTSVVFTASDSISPAEWTLWRLDLNGKVPARLIRGKQDDAFVFPTWVE